ncbi:MAG TPA: SMC family ATPase [Nocardioidaceae bacterium]|nr:SMC family ATPase [Nocardioidaceae bacterium]
MRLHRLTVSAFGPFAGTEHVDFDVLNEAGLFLVTGATGAGKSSLLDAVCFALYGTVPGVRGVKALKSQHAAIDAKPEVLLDFSVQGRRFVVRRSPEWTRPKRRGSGVLTEKASASILEVTSGREHLLSSRAAEVGLLVCDLMGMHAGQFVQVALLPQGEFQTFLRASSQDRHDVLQQLFRTDRFARIEDWVAEHSRRLRERAVEGHTAVQRILDTAADRAGVPVPESFDGDGLPTAAADGLVRAWAAELLDAATARARLERQCAEASRHDLHRARAAHDTAVRHAERRSRRDAALDALATLQQTEADARQAQHRLDASERADRCRPILELREEAVRHRDQAAAARQRATLGLAQSAGSGAPGSDEDALPEGLGLDDAGVSALVRAAQQQVARLTALLPSQHRAADVRRELEAEQERLTTAERELADVTRRCERVPAEVERATRTLSSVSAVAARSDQVEAALVAARGRHNAAVLLDALEPQLDALDEARRDARDRVQDAREHVQALVSRRLSGMAAELAGALVDGAACRVCGSTDHPRPAAPAQDAVTDLDHDRAEQQLAAASTAFEEVEQALGEARRRREGVATTCDGWGVSESASRVDELATELAAAVAARAEQAALEVRLRRLRDEQAALGSRRSDAAAAAAGCREAVAAHERTLAGAQQEIVAALGGSALSPEHLSPEDLAAADDDGTTALERAIGAWTRWCGRLVEAGRTVAAHDAAEERVAALTEQATAMVCRHGFSAIDEVDPAVLDPAERGRLEDLLQHRRTEHARARAVLDDPELAGLDQGPVHDIGRLAAELVEAERVCTAAAREQALVDDQVSSLSALLDRLDVAMRDWAPVRDESLRADAIARLVRGMGHDNQLQMRLSAYVLATRLDQVVAAANERLGHMRDHRYLLQRSGKAERRSAQSGLGLEVVDQWTGDVRAPSTLSGGETFVVSLSLALGLADVVTHESGGTEVETLFVDEGFGTLDADTLDDVMDRLDGLRAGGRTVGVVSHVTELRTRIPTQVHVDKGRSGSTVAVHTLVG